MTKKWLALLLTLVLLCSLSAAAYASDTPYVANITVVAGAVENTVREKAMVYRTTLLDKDLNDGAGGRFIFMGIGKSSAAKDAITGIVFYATDSDSEPPSTIVYNDVVFNLLGGPAEQNGPNSSYEQIVDLNKGAGGKYIYTYITRDPAYGPALTEIGVGSRSHPYVICNTYGNPQDLNEGCVDLLSSVPAIYLYAKPYEGDYVYARYYYLDANGLGPYRGNASKQLWHHEDSLSELPDVPATVAYLDYTLTFQGWTTDEYGLSAEPVSVTLADNTTDQQPKSFYAVYACTPKLIYNANGGSGAPDAQSVTIFNLNASGYQTAQQNFTISSNVPTHEDPCYEFLGWSTDPNATQPTYTAGQSVAFDKDTTLYAVWQPHRYGTLIPAHPATHTKDTLKPGMSAYYQCSICYGYFTESKAPTTIYDLIGETPAHTFEDSVCTECGYVLMLTGTRSHVVTYDANGGTGAMEPQRFSAGVAQKLTANAFNRPGYTFIGWNTAADGSGTSYRADTNFTAARSITLYA